jgi:hypothetical protein
MPFAAGDVRFDLACGKFPDGSWWGWHTVSVRACELRRLGIRPFQGPGRQREAAGMSLAVSAYIRGEELGESLAAGFENWRTQVWGSPQVRALGAVFFPELAVHDLRVCAADLPAFLEECALLRGHLDAIVAGSDLSGQTGMAVSMATGSVAAVGASREAFREQVALRLANIEAVADRALLCGGDVVIW